MSQQKTKPKKNLEFVVFLWTFTKQKMKPEKNKLKPKYQY